MQRTDFHQIFLESASEVLETMFFTAVLGDHAEAELAGMVAVALGFHGDSSGKFGIAVPAQTGRQIAANFLGLDEVSDAQVVEVVGELSNMLCGTVLSRFSNGSRFELQHPEMIISDGNSPAKGQAISTLR